MQQRKTQTFNDGICDLYSINDDDTISLIQGGLRFGDKTVGSQRFFAAKDYQHSADRMIRIPYNFNIPANTVVMIGGVQFNVLQVQAIYDTVPQCRQLTLEGIKEANAHDVYANA